MTTTKVTSPGRTMSAISKLISGNANMKGEMVKGSVRNGGGLLVGLLRCGHCGRKLKVLHNGLRGVARYVCNDASTSTGGAPIVSRLATCASMPRSRRRYCG